MDLGCSIAEEMQKSPLWGRVLSTLWFVEKLLIVVAIDISLSMSRDCIYYEHCFCHCEVCLAKARWLLSLVQQNPITLINKKFPNHPVCNFRKTKLPISWYKSRKLLNFYHSQTDQPWSVWLVQVCRSKRYTEFMGEIEMQTFGPEIGHQEGLTKAHNVSDVFCSRTAAPTTHVMPLSCLLVNFGWKVTILANPGTDCVSAGVNWLLNGQFRRNFRRFIGGEFIWSVKCAGQALCLNRAALQCARFHSFWIL